jgi:hypothetical protein
MNGFFTNDLKTYINLSVPKSNPNRKGKVKEPLTVKMNDESKVRVAVVEFTDFSKTILVGEEDVKSVQAEQTTKGEWQVNDTYGIGPEIAVGATRIAHMGKRLAYGTMTSTEEAKANAKIMAAAKEMKEALESLTGAILFGMGKGSIQTSVAMAMAALDKANGDAYDPVKHMYSDPIRNLPEF